MRDSYDYRVKMASSDKEVLRSIEIVRLIIADFKALDPHAYEGGPPCYLEEYDEMQRCYAAALTLARRRHLAVPAWEGDGLVFSPLVDRWVKVDDYRD